MDVLPDSDEERNGDVLGFSDDERMDLVRPPAQRHLGVTDDSISDYTTPLRLPSLPDPFVLPMPTIPTISDYPTPNVARTPVVAPNGVDASLSSIQLTGIGTSSDKPGFPSSGIPTNTNPSVKKGPRPRRLPPLPKPGAPALDQTAGSSGSSIVLKVPTFPTSETSPSLSGTHRSGPSPGTAPPKPVQFFDTPSSEVAASKTARNGVTDADDEDDPLLIQSSIERERMKKSEMTEKSEERHAGRHEENERRKRNVTYTSSAEAFHDDPIRQPSHERTKTIVSSRLEPITLSSDPVDDQIPLPTAAERVKMRARKSAAGPSANRKRAKTNGPSDEDDDDFDDHLKKRQSRNRAADSESEFEPGPKKKAPPKKARKQVNSDSEFEPDGKTASRKRRSSTTALDEDDDENSDAYMPSKRRKSEPVKPTTANKTRRLQSIVEVVVPAVKLPGRTKKAPNTTFTKSRKSTEVVLTSPHSTPEQSEAESMPSRSPTPPSRKRRKSEPMPKAKKGKAQAEFKSAEFVVSDDDSSAEERASKRRKSEPTPKGKPATGQAVAKTAGIVLSDDDSATDQPARKRRKSEPATKGKKGKGPAEFKSAEFVVSDDDDEPVEQPLPKRRKSEPATKATTAKSAKNAKSKALVSDDDTPSADELADAPEKAVSKTKIGADRRSKTEPTKAVTPPTSPVKPKETPSQRRRRERERARMRSEPDSTDFDFGELGAEDEEEHEVAKPKSAESKDPMPKAAKDAPSKVKDNEKQEKQESVPTSAPASSKVVSSVAAKENIPPLQAGGPTSLTPKPQVKRDATLAHSIPNRPLTLNAPRVRPRFGLSKSLGSKMAPLHAVIKPPPPRPPPVASKKKKKVESDVDDDEEDEEEIERRKKRMYEEDGDWEEDREREVVVEED